MLACRTCKLQMEWTSANFHMYFHLQAHKRYVLHSTEYSTVTATATYRHCNFPVSNWVSTVPCPAWHIIITGHFRDESFQAITGTGTDNSKQTAQKIHQRHKTKKLAHT